MAVERGHARCPRCMAWADYQILDRGDNMLEYEVRCTACGNLHSEVSVLSPATTVAA